jgi:hypothetical protein
MATISDTPDRTLLQRQDALARANEIRSKRSAFKRELKAGRVSLATLLLDPPAWLDTAKVFDLVRMYPALGRVKVNALFQRERIMATKTVAGLSDRQRAALVAFLRDREGMVVSPASHNGAGTAQALTALALAQRLRLTRADVKRKIASGEMRVADVLTGEDGAAVDSMTVFDLIASQHRWGEGRTRRLLAHLALRESKTVGSLTPRQVSLIVESLRAFEARS